MDRGEGHALLPGKLINGLITAVKLGDQLLNLLGRASNLASWRIFGIHHPSVAATPPPHQMGLVRRLPLNDTTAGTPHLGLVNKRPWEIYDLPAGGKT